MATLFSNKWDLRFLELAKLVASWSKDPSTQVGAVIVDEKKRVVSIGFNGLPSNLPDKNSFLHNRNIKYKVIIHAEENALLHSNKDLSKCVIYTWPFMPCSSCASKIIQSGIKTVISTDNIPERWKDSFELSKKILKNSGVKLKLMKYS